MYYKLYIQQFKEGSLENYDLFKDLARIYRDNGVIVLGHWINKNDSNETFLITIYKDEKHYNQFINKMKSDPQYQERQALLNSIREHFTSKDLEINKHSLIQPSNTEFMEYIKDVKSIVEDYS